VLSLDYFEQMVSDISGICTVSHLYLFPRKSSEFQLM